MIVTYLSEESDRANVLARLGVSYGVGMVVGPSLGGFVTSNFSEQSASLLAAAGSFLSILLVVLFVPTIPKTKSRIIDKTASSSQNSQSSFLRNCKEIGKLFFLPGVGFLLILKTVCGIPIGVLQSMFSSKLIHYLELVILIHVLISRFFFFSDCH